MTALEHKRRLAGGLLAGAVVVGFTVLVGWHYHFRFGAAALFLSAAGGAVVVSAWLLMRAALSFDLAPSAPVASPTADDRRREQLAQEKKLLLKAIKEMEFDRDTGKVDEVEAEQAIRRYRGRALEILEILEPRHDAKYEDLIQSEMARRLNRAVPPVAETPVAGAGGAAEGAGAPAAAAGVGAVTVRVGERSSASCPSCAAANDGDAVFCKKCGDRLQRVPA